MHSEQRHCFWFDQYVSAYRTSAPLCLPRLICWGDAMRGFLDPLCLWLSQRLFTHFRLPLYLHLCLPRLGDREKRSDINDTIALTPMFFVPRKQLCAMTPEQHERRIRGVESRIGRCAEAMDQRVLKSQMRMIRNRISAMESRKYCK